MASYVTFEAEQTKKHEELSKKIADNLQGEGGIFTEVTPHQVFDENLPEGITPALVNKLTKYVSDYMSASHIAAGMVATKAFKDDKKLEQANFSIGYLGKSDKIDIEVSRSKKYQNRFSEDAQEVTKHLVMKTVVTSKVVSGSGLKSLREAMSSEFEQRFAK